MMARSFRQQLQVFSHEPFIGFVEITVDRMIMAVPLRVESYDY